MSVEPRKRNRKSTSCTVCRKRKTRCDRVRPFCGRCVLDNCIDQCEYEAGEAPATKELSEVEELKRRIAGLETLITSQKQHSDDDSQIKFQELSIGEPSVSSGSGPYTLSSTGNGTFSDLLSSKSRTTQSTSPGSERGFEGHAVLRSNLVYLRPTSYVSVSLTDPTSTQVFENLGVQVNPDDRYAPRAKGCFGESDMVELNYTKDIGRLPKSEVVESMVSYFFTGYQYFCPFIDQSMIPSLMDLLDDKGTYCTIQSSKINRSSLIAMLLIILRFVYLSKPSLSLGYNVTESFVTCAAGILTSISAFKHISVNKLQGLLLLKIYRRHCVEGEDSTEEAVMLDSIVVTTARVLGLDRPTPETGFISPSDREVRDKCWKYACYLDSFVSFNVGAKNNILPHEVRHDDGDLKLMCDVSREVLAFLSQEGSHQVEHSLVLRTIQRLNRISNQKTLQQILDYKDSNLFKSANEFVVRLDLVYKQFILYWLAAKSADEDQKRFLALAFERGLILLKTVHEHTTTKTFFSMEIDKFISSQIWSLGRHSLVPFTAIFQKFLDEQLSIFECFKSFDSPDSNGMMSWIEVDFGSETSTLVNIVRKLQEIYANGSLLSFQFYPAFKACMFAKNALEMLSKKNPEFMTVVNSDVETEGVFDFGWKLPKLTYEEVEGSWFEKDDIRLLQSTDHWFSGIDEDIDKLFLDLEDLNGSS